MNEVKFIDLFCFVTVFLFLSKKLNYDNSGVNRKTKTYFNWAWGGGLGISFLITVLFALLHRCR